MSERAPSAVADVAADEQQAEVPTDEAADPAVVDEAAPEAEAPAEDAAPEEVAVAEEAAPEAEPAGDAQEEGTQSSVEKRIDLLAFCAQIGLVGVVVGDAWPLCVLP